MIRYRLTLAAALAVVLNGCTTVAIQPVLPPTAVADAQSGYVAGQFSRTKGRGFAFIVRSTDGKAEYTLPLGEDSTFPTDVNDQTVAMKLPPGWYTVSAWITYATLTKEVMSRKPITDSPLSEPFSVRAGAVVHLGSYNVTTYTESAYPSVNTFLRITPRRLTEAEVQTSFKAAYPQFAAMPFQCVLCMDTVKKRAPSK